MTTATFFDSADPRPLAWRSTWASLGLLLLTSVHHAYGAWRYATPWRLHAAAIAVVVGAAIIASCAAFVARSGKRFGALALGVLTLLIVVVPIAGFGAFEGFYNHVLKNILFFGGASPEVLGRLFPSPTYEMPDDVWFEISGVLQAPVAVLAARAHWVLLRRAVPRLGRRLTD